MDNKLILVVCGAGINTSTMASEFIKDELAKRKIGNVDVKTILINDLQRYQGRENMVIVFMTKVDTDMGVPSFQGLNFLIGDRETKLEIFENILDALGEKDGSS